MNLSKEFLKESIKKILVEEAIDRKSEEYKQYSKDLDKCASVHRPPAPTPDLPQGSRALRQAEDAEAEARRSCMKAVKEKYPEFAEAERAPEHTLKYLKKLCNKGKIFWACKDAAVKLKGIYLAADPEDDNHTSTDLKNLKEGIGTMEK